MKKLKKGQWSETYYQEKRSLCVVTGGVWGGGVGHYFKQLKEGKLWGIIISTFNSLCSLASFSFFRCSLTFPPHCLMEMFSPYFGHSLQCHKHVRWPCMLYSIFCTFSSCKIVLWSLPSALDRWQPVVNNHPHVWSLFPWLGSDLCA